MKKDKDSFIDMSSMSNHYDEPLDGKEKVNSNTTEATNDTQYKLTQSKVSVTDDEGVEAAKDWVDNGSKL